MDCLQNMASYHTPKQKQKTKTSVLKSIRRESIIRENCLNDGGSDG